MFKISEHKQDNEGMENLNSVRFPFSSIETIADKQNHGYYEWNEKSFLLFL